MRTRNSINSFKFFLCISPCVNFNWLGLIRQITADRDSKDPTPNHKIIPNPPWALTEPMAERLAHMRGGLRRF
ncbi:hypothetical protein I7I48_12090 [Histoplasma ohiense]|nr:hypothetical protein I7I48_12090 [Histoplasma ohiense (nom. inval.)]